MSYIQTTTAVPKGVADDGVMGPAPQMFWGSAALDGTANPFLSAVMGTQYVRSSAGVVACWVKTANTGASTDWVAVPMGTALLTAAEVDYLDLTTLGTGAASKAVVLDANSDYIWPAAGTLTFGTATNGSIAGAGASGANHALGATALNGLEFYLNATHTTGDMRGEYLRLYFSGVGGSGEAARIFSTVNNVAAATVHGAHISLSFGTTGSITGLGVASRNTLHIPKAMTAGTYYVQQLEFWADATTSDTAGMTAQAFTNYNLGGDGTGKALIEDTVNLFAITGGTIAGSNLVETETAETKFSHKIRIDVYGTPMWLMVCDS